MGKPVSSNHYRNKPPRTAREARLDKIIRIQDGHNINETSVDTQGKMRRIP